LANTGDAVDCYELVGARVYTYEELVRSIAAQIKTRSTLMPMPFAFWRILASGAEMLPSDPLTRNQVALMQRDNIASGDFPGLGSLNIAPRDIDDVVSEIAGGR
jgi:NADH dehydrogenase